MFVPKPALLMALVLALATGVWSDLPKFGSFNNGALIDSDNNANLMFATCNQLDLKIWCNLITMYKSDPTIAKLFDGTSAFTFFAPTDRGIHNVSPRFPAEMKTTLGRMLDGQDPAVATAWIRAHMITNEEPIAYSGWLNEVWTNNLGQTLTVVEGTGRGVPPGSRHQFFIQGPKNIVRAGFQDRWDILGGASLLQVVEDPLLA